MRVIPQALLNNRSRPEVRAVLGDMREEAGLSPERWLMTMAQRLAAGAAADADDDADDTAAAAADADAAAADADDDAADDTAAEDADGTAADDADGTADALKQVNYWRRSDMREGLLLLQLPGRYWSVTRVGYARRVEGDEWEFRGATVLRTGAVRTLSSLASEGPKKDHNVSEVDALPELLHRFSPRRVLAANEKAWAKHVKKPEGW